MKKILCAICLSILAFQLASAQQTTTTVRLGVHLQPNFITSNNPHYKLPMHKGIFLEIDKGKLWTPTITLSYYLGKFQSRESGLLLDDLLIPNQGVSPGFSTLVNNVREHGLDMSMVFNRKIKMKGLTPFIGLGLDLQIPLVVSGERYIVHASGFREQLVDPSINLGIVNPGLILQVGGESALSDRFTVVVLFGSKSNYIPNASSISNTMTQIQKRVSGYQRFFAQLGISYALQSKKVNDQSTN